MMAFMADTFHRWKSFLAQLGNMGIVINTAADERSSFRLWHYLPKLPLSPFHFTMLGVALRQPEDRRQAQEGGKPTPEKGIHQPDLISQ